MTATATTHTAPGRAHKGRKSLFSDPFDEHRSVQVDQTLESATMPQRKLDLFAIFAHANKFPSRLLPLGSVYWDGHDIATFHQVADAILFSRRRSDGELTLFGSRRRVIFKNTIPMELHSDCGRCLPERGVYLAHRQCWQVARSVFPDQLERLLRFAVSTRRLLVAIETKLPTELQDRLLRMLHGTPLWHMLHTREQAVPLIHKADRYNLDVRPVTVPVRGGLDGELKTLSASFETLFFVDYIKDLHFNTEKSSKHGLRGLRIMYVDGSKSPWLGSTKGCLFGTAHGSDLQQLCMLKSAFTVIRVAFGASNLQSEGDRLIYGHKVIHPLWDRELFFDPDHYHAFRPLETGSLSIMIPYYRNWRAFHYLPLQFSDGYASGLTFYNARSGKCGVTVHGPVPRADDSQYTRKQLTETVTLGSKDGIATHFALGDDETFTTFHVRESGSVGSSPVISVTTSRGRKFNFGPHLYCQMLPNDHFFTEHWAGLNCPGDVPATGIFFHAPDIPDNPDTIMPALPKELGVCLATSARLSSPATTSAFNSTHWPSAACRVPPAIDTGLYAESSAHSVYSSTARLQDISALDVRQRGIRIVGLLVTHGDGTRESLGQWLPPDADAHASSTGFRHQRIYERAPGGLSLLALDFHMRDLEAPLSARSNLLIVSHIECRLEQPMVEGEDKDSKRCRGTSAAALPSFSSTAFPPGHPRGTRVVKSFSCSEHFADRLLVWWTTFAADEVAQVAQAAMQAAPVDAVLARVIG
ncbi:hypothetical protein CFO_g2175 [Ceratocystis platani]|uniref:Uncharacterized protein n=1 Tax=Ceratocystis fimbriata f. sp. platani TaxID=88771 RepID=A0A0F8B2A1_CERFI|nr:hypothetical protein CFO_g2175 [Ceratocystis platani]